MLADKPWEGANGPDRVDLPVAQDEKDAVAHCRGLVEKGDHDAAGKALDEILAKDPANWDAYFLRAQSLHARSADADAALALRASLIGNRRSPDAWKLLDEVAKALKKKVARPRVEMRGWVREAAKGESEMGHVADDATAMPWNYYAAARLHYRHEGPFARDFPGAKTYAFTFREQMYAMGVLAASAADEKKDGTKLTPDLVRVLAEKKAGTLAPFTFFAVYTEPVPAAPEKDFDKLRPRLEKYFDEKILVKR
jgi:tetratricopeptide (TPR) repeat protein